MTAETAAIQPPAPVVHAKDLGSVRLLFTIVRNSLATWPCYAFDVPFIRSTLFGIESVVINDPAGIRQSYRPKLVTARIGKAAYRGGA